MEKQERERERDREREFYSGYSYFLSTLYTSDAIHFMKKMNAERRAAMETALF